MKLEMSGKESGKVLDIFTGAVKEAADFKAQSQKLGEQLLEWKNKFSAQSSEANDLKYQVGRNKETIEGWKRDYNDMVKTSDERYNQNLELRKSNNALTAEIQKLKDTPASPGFSGDVEAQIRTAVADRFDKALSQAFGLMGTGNKIQAIKVIREHTGMGLKEAKDLVEGNLHNYTSTAHPLEGGLPSSKEAKAAPKPKKACGNVDY